MLIAMQIATLVEECGCEAIGPFAWGRDALSFLKRQTIDAAILDIELLDGASTPLARVLRETGAPMIVLSGLRAKSPPPEFAGVDWLTKPADENRLRAFLAATAAIVKSKCSQGDLSPGTDQIPGGWISRGAVHEGAV